MNDVGSLLDVGCGNGRLAQALTVAGLAVRYTGIDASDVLLAIAVQGAHAVSMVQYVSVTHISQNGWTTALLQNSYDAIALLAVLHHMPGWERRVALLRSLKGLLAVDGLLQSRPGSS